jgi:hypothetical protein
MLAAVDLGPVAGDVALRLQPRTRRQVGAADRPMRCASSVLDSRASLLQLAQDGDVVAVERAPGASGASSGACWFSLVGWSCARQSPSV